MPNNKRMGMQQAQSRIGLLLSKAYHTGHIAASRSWGVERGAAAQLRGSAAPGPPGEIELQDIASGFGLSEIVFAPTGASGCARETWLAKHHAIPPGNCHFRLR
jgi:hypothetical protein